MQKGETMKKKILLMLIPLLAMTQSSYASYRMEEWEEGIEQINGMTVFLRFAGQNIGQFFDGFLRIYRT